MSLIVKIGKKSPAAFDAVMERMSQIEDHNRSILKDAVYNDSNQLVDAADFLDELPTSRYGAAYLHSHLPFGWDLKIWLKMCRKNTRQRKIMAISLRMADIDREDFIRECNSLRRKKQPLSKTQQAYYELRKIKQEAGQEQQTSLKGYKRIN